MTDDVSTAVEPGRGLATGTVSVILAITVGVAATLCHASPTGSSGTDAIVTFIAAAFVAWAGASAPWWSIAIGAVVATIGTAFSPWMGLAVLGLVLAIAVSFSTKDLPWLRIIATGCVVLAVLNLRLSAFLGESAIVAGLVMLFVTIIGVVCRPSPVRRRAVWSMAGFGVLILLAAAGMAAGAFQARDKLELGNRLLTDGFDQLRDGDTTKAADSLSRAATYLHDAGGELDSVWTRPARLLPVVAQHRALATDIVQKAATAAAAAADALAVADVDQLRLTSGKLDVAVLGKLAVPFAALDASVRDLAAAFDDGDSPWLIDAVRTQLTKARPDIDKALVQTGAIAGLAASGPAMLGTEGPRHYLVAFTSPGEARGQGGVMDDYAEITVTDGQISQTVSGRTADLIAQLAAAPPLHLHASPDYFERYGEFGAGSGTVAVDPNFWTHATMDPDTPTTASVLSQMYAASGHTAVDGVIVMDPLGIAALLDVAGPVDVAVGNPPVTQHIDAARLRQFLLLDQYRLADADRQIAIEAAAGAALQQFLGRALPGPQQLGDALGPPATEGHISWWATRPDEQAVIELIGISARLPSPDGADGLAVVSDNLGGNTIDPFLRRTITYTAAYDAASHEVTADLVVTLQNTAPATGYGDYVIGNTLGLAVGTNRTRLSVYSPLTAAAVTVDGATPAVRTSTELGWNVSTTDIDLAQGRTTTVRVHLTGHLAADSYSLIWRPQPMTMPDTFTLDVTGAGAPISHSGELVRTSVIDVDGIRAER